MIVVKTAAIMEALTLVLQSIGVVVGVLISIFLVRRLYELQVSDLESKRLLNYDFTLISKVFPQDDGGAVIECEAICKSHSSVRIYLLGCFSKFMPFPDTLVPESRVKFDESVGGNLNVVFSEDSIWFLAPSETEYFSRRQRLSPEFVRANPIIVTKFIVVAGHSEYVGLGANPQFKIGALRDQWIAFVKGHGRHSQIFFGINSESFTFNNQYFPLGQTVILDSYGNVDKVNTEKFNKIILGVTWTTRELTINLRS